MEIEQNPVGKSASGPKPDQSEAGRLQTLLVADDLELMRDLARYYLEPLGCDIDLATNGDQAVQAVGSRHYDLVLMDIQMPIMDGVEATRSIRAMGGLRSQVPIVAFTTNIEPEQVASYLGAGMNDHIPKPINRQMFVEKVRQWLAMSLPEHRGSAHESPPEWGVLFDRSVFEEFVDLFGADATKTWLTRFRLALDPDHLAEVAATGDRAELARYAHAMIAQAGTLGFTRLTNLLRALERSCIGNEPMSGLLDATIDACRQSRQTLDTLS